MIWALGLGFYLNCDLAQSFILNALLPVILLNLHLLLVLHDSVLEFCELGVSDLFYVGLDLLLLSLF